MKFRQLANIAIAFLLLPFCRSLRRQKFVLIGGHEGELVADNSKALYEFLTVQQRDFAVYWIINNDSPDRAGVSAPIMRGSVQNYLRFMTADGVFFSHTCSDVAPILHNFWRGTAVRVFIEHGVVGLKKAKLAPDSRSSHLGPEADLWVCSSQFEKDIKVREWGLPEERVRITGLARYDKLLPQPSYRSSILHHLRQIELPGERELGEPAGRGRVAGAVVRAAERLVGEELDRRHRSLDARGARPTTTTVAARPDRVPREPDRLGPPDDLERGVDAPVR